MRRPEPLDVDELCRRAEEDAESASERIALAVASDESVAELHGAIADLVAIPARALRSVRITKEPDGRRIEVVASMDRRRVGLELSKDDASRVALARGGGVLLVHRVRPGDEELSRELAERLKARAAELFGASAVVTPITRALGDGVEPRGAVRPVPSGEPAAEPGLRTFFREYERYFAHPLPLTEREGAPGVVRASFDRRDLPEDNSFFQLPPRLQQEPATGSYLRALGFDWDETGVVRTVPLPASYRQARSQLGLDRLGFSPHVVTYLAGRFVTAPWLEACLRRELEINLVSEWYYRATRPLRLLGVHRLRSARRNWLAHFTTLGHDMSVHTLGTHLLSRSLLRGLARRSRDALGGAADQAPRRLLRSVVDFYDSDLFLHCRAAWQRAETVSDVAASLAERSSIVELSERLERRLGID